MAPDTGNMLRDPGVHLLLFLIILKVLQQITMGHSFTSTQATLLAVLVLCLRCLGASAKLAGVSRQSKECPKGVYTDVYINSFTLCEKQGLFGLASSSKCRTANALDICSDAPTVACESIKKCKCGFMYKDEYFQVYQGQDIYRGNAKYEMQSGSGEMPDPKEPKWIATGDEWGLWNTAVSLACQGKVVVRSIFQMHKQPKPRSTCTGVRLTPRDPAEAATVQVVRCLLDLPTGAGTEAERATKGKEVKCWRCGECGASGMGCPSVQGAWYVDTYTTVARGCGFDRSAGFEYQVAGMRVEPGNNAQVVKFEVCNDPGCFDQAHEAKKLASAQPCTEKSCVF